MRLRPFLVTVAIIGGLAVSSALWMKSERNKRSVAVADLKIPEPESVQLPHGRVFYVVVETNGIYVGEMFIAFADFKKFLEDKKASLKPDYAIIMGTETAQYGRFVNAYTTTLGVLNIPATINTEPIDPGTRRGPIEVHEHFWEY